MKLHVEILDDDGKILAEHTADASSPSQWRTQSGQKFIAKMPPNGDNPNNGTYELFGFTFQPHVKVDRPNGWTTPPPASPLNGLPSGFPVNQSWGTKISTVPRTYLPALPSSPPPNTSISSAPAQTQRGY
jgi:hypothetical protein